jgi:sugar/nucleoside kinase (ribokinase family)
MFVKELKFDPNSLRFNGIIGTGGIGSGKFFVLNGDHTLGREESRSGHFLDASDYCKQHIILYYIKVLLGTSFSVIPVGKLGNDDIGQNLFKEMSEAGFVMNRVEKVPNVSTLFSFCFSYPDGSGGNMTTDNSASSQVDADFIEMARTELEKFGNKGIVMSAPEVPLPARLKLLEMGKHYGLYCTASFTTEEINNVLDAGIMTNIDLIAINIDEAKSFAESPVNKTDTASIVQSAIQKLHKLNKNIIVSITAGEQGSWCWDGHRLNSFPAVNTGVISTAGAGDAFFSGILCGLALGLHLFDAQQIASLVAGLSVTSPHTIHKGINRYSLLDFLHTTDIKFSEIINKLLED